jgi:hypothetical protein
VTEESVFDFIRKNIKSIWSVELLLVLARDRDRVWREDELIREMRSSSIALGAAVRNLQAAGLVVTNGDGVRYDPASTALDGLVAEIDRVYANKPSAVVKAIFSAPNDKLQSFADAFKLKRD